ncbi:extracellular solute-binding protein [Paenibacillus sp. CGMCC 1.16610]|uniref:Extracellular solute-binding protein n=2 Tax=Paenibacillus TaxID=44249 RepID=A0ABW9UAY2_9BACL|nr:extracellular solute-binding protein [Paenibacillus sp. CGMCC 1.16610]MVQ36428.1 extracellular solute-binding protein [Paenibacillus anseongense]
MKMRKELIMGATVLTVVAALSGCSKGGENKIETKPSPAIAANLDAGGDKQLDLSVAIWDIQTGFDDANAKNDTVYTDLAKQFNMTVKPVQITWNDWQDKMKVWAASNQLPDIFVNALATDNPGLYETWAKQGVIKPIPDDLSAYPNLKKILSHPSVQPLKINGKFYMIPRMTYADSGDWILDRPIRYRKDWAAEAGYTKDPASFDEFMTMTKAVMAKHPGVTGITIQNKAYLLTQFLGSFPEMTNVKSWVKEEGKWIPSFASEKAYTGIQQLRTLYTDGLLDKDFAIQKDADGVSKFLAGQSFALYGMQDFSSDKVEQFKKANPGVSPSKSVGFMNIWKSPDGKRYSFVETPYWSEAYFPNSLSDEKFARALKLLDYMVSDAYLFKATNGVENVDYKTENGKSVSLLKENEKIADKYPITKNMAFLGAWNNGLRLTGKVVVSSDSEMNTIQDDLVTSFNKFKSEDSPAPINFDVMLLSTPAKNKLGSLNVPDDIVKVILGKDDPVTQWKEMVKGYNAKGVQTAIQEVNDEVTKRGIK